MNKFYSSVDVVILSWDRIDDTIAAIQSALRQRNVNARVIVVDQGSSSENIERLVEFCKSDDRIVLHCNAVNSGVPGGRNQGAALGVSDFICSLDNDAEFTSENEVSKAAEILEANPKIGVLAFRIHVYSTMRDDASSWAYPNNIVDAAGQSFEAAQFVGAGHMIRRQVFDKIGGYDDVLFFLHEEIELSYRIMNCGYSILYCPDVSIRHKVSPEKRVFWNGQRTYYDVRNKLYMMMKFRYSVRFQLGKLFNECVQAARQGNARHVIAGILSAMKLFPRSVLERQRDPSCKLTPQTKFNITNTNAAARQVGKSGLGSQE